MEVLVSCCWDDVGLDRCWHACAWKLFVSTSPFAHLMLKNSATSSQPTKMSFLRGRIVLSAFVVLTFATFGAEAGFQCEDSWTGPSANNSILDCNPQEVYLARTGTLIKIAFPLVVFIFTLLCYPTIFCCRQVCKCCGSNRRRPGITCCGGSEWDDETDAHKEEMYTAGEVMRAKACTFILWLIGMACLVLMVLGSTLMGDAYDRFFVELQGLPDWADTQMNNIQTTMTLDDGTLVPGFPADAVSSGLEGSAQIRTNIADMKTSADTYLQTASYVALGVGVGPIVLLVIGTLFAVCDVRTCGPACLTCFFFLFIIVYTLLGTIFFVLNTITVDVCDEIDKQLASPPQPGLIQWLVVPMCTDTLDFGTIRQSVESAERSNSIDGCRAFTAICDAVQTYDSSRPNYRYVCNINNATIDCPTFNAFSRFVNSSDAKGGVTAPVMCNSVPNSACGVRQCATDCADQTQRSATAEVVQFLDFASRALRSFTNYIVPLFDCNNLLSVALRPFADCRNLAQSMEYIAAGSTMYSLVFVLGICAQFRGQKRFFKKKQIEDKEPANENEPYVGVVVGDPKGNGAQHGATPTTTPRADGERRRHRKSQRRSQKGAAPGPDGTPTATPTSPSPAGNGYPVEATQEAAQYSEPVKPSA